MALVKKYDLGDPKDVKKLNKLLNPIGISVEEGMIDLYVLVETSRYERFTRRNAGRRSVQTPHVRQKVFTLRAENMSVREIAETAGISVGTVANILKDYEKSEETNQPRLF